MSQVEAWLRVQLSSMVMSIPRVCNLTELILKQLFLMCYMHCLLVSSTKITVGHKCPVRRFSGALCSSLSSLPRDNIFEAVATKKVKDLCAAGHTMKWYTGNVTVLSCH